MKKWILKAFVQKVISFLPFSHNINFFFQKYVTRGINLSDEYFEDRLAHCREHFKCFRKYCLETNFSHLEIGTGWYPVVPLGMYLQGAGSITTIDLTRLADENRFRITLKKYHRFHQQGKLSKSLPGIAQNRLETLLNEAENPSCNSMGALLEKFRIEYYVGDARKIPLKDNSFDLITSNNTFEHIYQVVLYDLLNEFKRVCKKGGVMSHAIDMSDHFAHLDTGITIYNFLKFSDAQWKWINNSVQPMNRMRIYDYKKLYNKSGISITEVINREYSIAEYNKIKTDKIFLSHPAEENAVSHSQIVSLM